jgi:hypothetical protein
MEFSQNYARPSSASLGPNGLSMEVSAELSRPPVALRAMVRDSLSYARLMLALYEVVSGDHRGKPKDHTAYQQWVQERYLEELPEAMAAAHRNLADLKRRDEAARELVRDIQRRVYGEEAKLATNEFYNARGRYYKWLLTHDRHAWMLLDPVVSVHPDCTVFEVFSIDESSYGRVTVPMDKLECLDQTVFGTTNVDYSSALADEFRRVRNYRPAFITIGGGDVSIATAAGERLEKKIDLPPTWVRGFLQVQSAAAFPSTDLTLSGTTFADILGVLKSRREDHGPRSLRFNLTPGECPTITVEPWNIVIREPLHKFIGSQPTEIRVWGRRRLMALDNLLAYAEDVQVRLLGTGMPSYWSVQLDGHRFDLGISGWTKNDWSRAARFDLLSSTGAVSPGDVEQAAEILSKRLFLTPEELATQADMPREAATVALQRLCREGRAMYDFSTPPCPKRGTSELGRRDGGEGSSGLYRWRQLMPFPVEIEEEDDRVHLAKRLIATGGVRWLKPGEDESEFGAPNQAESATRYRAQVRGGEEKRERKFQVIIDLDADGRAIYAQCNCAWHRREKLRKGPCAHILAATILASQQSVGAAPQTTASAKGATLRLDRFKGQTIVFTGALSIFTREQAEALVHQGGGKTAGSVSKNTTLLVVGEKAGSKLAKARELNIPVVSEEQFQAMLNDTEAKSGGAA